MLNTQEYLARAVALIDETEGGWTGEWLRRLLLFPAIRLVAPLEVRGVENLTGCGPFIFAANHTSHLDAPLILAALPRQLRLKTRVAAAADYFFNTGWKSVLVRTFINAFPFNRDKTGCLNSLHEANFLIEGGQNLVIFPEGTRSPSGQIQHFKRGVGWLATQPTGAQVVPVRIQGAFEVLPKGSKWPRPHRVRVTFGAPTRFPANANPVEVAATIEQQVKEL